jgi:hypothetical protein
MPTRHRRYNHHGKPKARREIALENLKHRFSNGTHSSIGNGDEDYPLTDKARAKIEAEIAVLEDRIK